MPAKNRNQLNPLICKQCGAPIDPHTYICQYCDTKYERGEEKLSKSERRCLEECIRHWEESMRRCIITPREAEDYLRMAEFFPSCDYPEGVKTINGEIGCVKDARIIVSGTSLTNEELDEIDRLSPKRTILIPSKLATETYTVVRGKKGDGEKYFKRIIQKIRNRRNKNCPPKTEINDIS